MKGDKIQVVRETNEILDFLIYLSMEFSNLITFYV